MEITDLNQFADDVYNLAKLKGWYDKPESEDAFVERACNNLHDEISELHTAWRENKLWEPCDKAHAMEMECIEPLSYAEEEFADIIIRVLDDCRHLKINIVSALERKHAFNKTRPYRHGNKRS
jgi:NTP pyrophosphatase (non-canonical NTP hydrolase)